MRRVSVMAIVCFAASCGGNDANCDFSAISGTYKVHFSGESGNCGDLPDLTVFLDGGDQSADPGCTMNHQAQDEAACTADIDETCPTTSGTIQLVGHVNVDADGKHFDGVATFAVTGRTTCTSTYKISYDKL